MGEVFAFSLDRTSQLTGLSISQLRRWDEIGLYSPEFADEDRRQPYSRMYSFRDIVGLRTLAQLRRRVSLSELRKIGDWLRLNHDAPWASLRFYLIGKKVLIADPDSGLKVTIRPPGQQPLPTFALEEIARDTRRAVERMRERSSENIGKIVRQRNIFGNAPIIAGTRIPTAAVWDFHEEGFSAPEIIKEYPQLTPPDIAAAIHYEQQRRKIAG